MPLKPCIILVYDYANGIGDIDYKLCFLFSRAPAEIMYTGVLTEETGLDVEEVVSEAEFSEDLMIDHGSSDGVSAEVELVRLYGYEDLAAELSDRVQQETSVDLDHVQEEVSVDHVQEETSVDHDHVKEETSVDCDHVQEETSDLVSAVDDGTSLDAAVEEGLKEEATVVISTSPVTEVALQNDQHKLDFSLAGNNNSTITECPDASCSVSDNDLESAVDRAAEHEYKSVSSSNRNAAEGCTSGVEIADEESCHTEEVEGTRLTEDTADVECDSEADVVLDSDVVVCGAVASESFNNGSSVDAVDCPAPVAIYDTIQSSEETSQDDDPAVTRQTRI